MKQIKRLALWLLVLSLLLSVPALAATSGYTADKETDAQYAGTVNRVSEGVYTAELGEIVENSQLYSVIVTTATTADAISADNILYIDVQQAAGGKVSFTIRPKSIAEANVYVGGVFTGSVTSPVLVGKLLSDKPAVPAAPAIKAKLASGVVTISWDAVDGAAKYTLQRSTFTGSTWGKWEDASKNTTDISYTDTTAVIGTKYRYRCAAANSGGWSKYSNIVTVIPVNKPAKPTATSASGKVSVSWTAVTGATKYTLSRRAYSGSAWGAWEDLSKSITATSYTDSAVTEGTKYQYRLNACGAGVWSGYSSAAEVTVTSTAVKPEAPVIGVTVTPDKVTVKWAAVANATKYTVYRSVYTGSTWGTWAKLETVPATSYADSGVSVGNKYRYRVAAVGPGGSSGYSNVATATVVAKPDAPVITVTATAGKNTVKWNAVTGATKYSVYRRTYNGSTWSSWETIKTVYGTNYADTAVTAGTKYQYRVATCNSGVWSSYSNSVAVTAK